MAKPLTLATPKSNHCIGVCRLTQVIIVADGNKNYRARIGGIPRKSAIFNLISEMPVFDSHVPGAIPAQFLPGLILTPFQGWVRAPVRFQVSQPVRG